MDRTEMIISSYNKSTVNEKADVCIIGSGAGGAVLAKELSEAGKDVVLLEEGGHYTSRDFNQRELDMVPMLYRERGALATDDQSIPIIHGSCLGGTTVINNLVCYRTPDHILKKWARDFGITGLSKEELEPSFKKVEKFINVVPSRPDEINKSNLMLKKGCDALGYRGEAIKRNVIDCMQCGFCMLGCAYDRKQSMLVTYIPAASKNGARIYANCRVNKISAKNGVVTGVEGTLLDQKTRLPVGSFNVDAKIVIVAAGAISSPKLLLSSGLANSSGKVGRDFSLHPSMLVLALFDEKIDGYKGPVMSYASDEFFSEQSPNFMLEGVFGHPATIATTTPSFGKIHKTIMKDYNHYAAMIVQIHDESVGSLCLDKKARLSISYTLTDADRKKMKQGAKEAAKVFLSAGAKRVIVPTEGPTIINTTSELEKIEQIDLGPNRVFLYSAHPLGGCKMGENPQESVINSHCEAHDVKNLFVCDGSSFPSSIGVNPQLTIMALATHTAKNLIDNWNNYV